MSICIADLKETLQARHDDMLNNRMLTNELIIDDIMVELGYNKKRDASVKRLYQGPIDWDLRSADDKRLAVKVFAIGEAINTDELQETMKFCAEKRFSILIVTNGEAMTICRYNKETNEYIEVLDISLTEELTEQGKTVLDAISKNSFNIQLIDDMLKPVTISLDEVKEIFESSKDNLKDMLAKLVNEKVPDCTNTDEQLELFINSLGQKAEVNEVVSVDNKAEVEELNSTITKLNEEIETLKNELSNKVAEESNNELATNTINELNTKIEELQTIIDSNKTVIAEAESKSADKDAKIVELEAELSKAKESDNSTNAISGQLTADIEKLQAELDEANNTIKELQTNEKAELAEDEQSYVDKIRDLSTELSNAKEEVEKYQKQTAELEDKLSNLSGSDRQKAKDLLDLIEDTPDMNRHYVAVINSELLQFEELHTFVGRVLQKLYELKNFEAQTYIYNGEIFRLESNSQHNDIMMNNKNYDIILGTLSEDEVLNKIRIVFSHFGDIVFECKKIGTLREKAAEQSAEEVTTENEETESIEFGTDTVESMKMSDDFDDNNVAESDNNENTFDESDLFSEDATDFGNTQAAFSHVSLEKTAETVENADEMFDNIDGFDNGFDNTTEGFSEQETAEQSNDLDDDLFGGAEADGQMGEADLFDDVTPMNMGNAPEYLLAGQLLRIDDLIWTEENVAFNEIKYIGTNSVTFAINGEFNSYDALLAKCIDAILAIEAYNRRTDIIVQLKQKDFSLVNNFLKLYTEDYRGYPRINGTKYVIAGIESVAQVASVLLDICNEMNINTSETFIYFKVNTDSQFIIDNYSFPEESIQIRENLNYPVSEQPQLGVAIIKGDMFNNIVVTKNSLQVHKEVFVKSLAIKTKYLAKVLKTFDDVAAAIDEMITNAEHNGLPINYQGIGNVIGTSYKVLSVNESEVTENRINIQTTSGIVYLSTMEDWQVTHALIKVHTTLFNNTAIAVKNNVNIEAINFYGTDFDTAEPSLSLAVNSFVGYVTSCIKNS